MTRPLFIMMVASVAGGASGSAPLVASYRVQVPAEASGKNLIQIGEGDFVRLPKTPEHQVRRSETILGPIDTDVYAATNDVGSFVVAQTRIPTLALIFTTDAGLCERAAEQMMRELKGYPLSSRSIQEGGFEHELEYTVPHENAVGRARFAVLGKTLVAVAATVSASKVEALDQFFHEPRSGGSAR